VAVGYEVAQMLLLRITVCLGQLDILGDFELTVLLDGIVDLDTKKRQLLHERASRGSS